MADIIIGEEAINRNWTYEYGSTLVNQGNPAEVAGTITTVEIWAATNLANCEVAIFHIVSGSNLSTGDFVTVDNGNGAGVVLAGEKQTFTVSLDVQIGDYIGMYYTAGTIEKDTTGYGDMWIISGDQIPCTNVTFDVYADDAISLRGIGTTEEEPTYNYYGYNSS